MTSDFANDWLAISKPVNDIDRAPDRRDFFRLNLDKLETLDACTVLENGNTHTVEILNISASGLYCQTAVAYNFMQERKLTVYFILPLDEPMVLKIPCRLVEVKWHPVQQTTEMRLKFIPGLATCNQDMIHRFIVTRQLQELRTENAY
jgi:c-di-GMP-binding flagellar brake protein YcgR